MDRRERQAYTSGTTEVSGGGEGAGGSEEVAAGEGQARRREESFRTRQRECRCKGCVASESDARVESTACDEDHAQDRIGRCSREGQRSEGAEAERCNPSARKEAIRRTCRQSKGTGRRTCEGQGRAGGFEE